MQTQYKNPFAEVFDLCKPLSAEVARSQASINTVKELLDGVGKEIAMRGWRIRLADQEFSSVNSAIPFAELSARYRFVLAVNRRRLGILEWRSIYFAMSPRERKALRKVANLCALALQMIHQAKLAHPKQTKPCLASAGEIV